MSENKPYFDDRLNKGHWFCQYREDLFKNPWVSKGGKGGKTVTEQ